MLQLQLSPAATARVARLSEHGAGIKRVMALDGEILASATLTSPISQGAVQLRLERPLAQVELICTLLKTGAMSASPQSIRIVEKSWFMRPAATPS